MSVLSHLLSSVSTLTPSPCVIMIDGLNYLVNDNNCQSVNWLPDVIPPVSMLKRSHEGSDINVWCLIIGCHNSTQQSQNLEYLVVNVCTV